ncbi:MAG TPA: hypothetical protein GX392_03950 [Clostridiales bacterium]|nr:hypothetical protein [Clostridiales bacterium]
MIRVIFGDRGTGKTKQIIDMANGAATEGFGDVVFIDSSNCYTIALDRKIRYININDYDIKDLREFYGFLSGVIAQNYDIDTIYMDGLLDMYRQETDAIETFFGDLKKLADNFNVKFYMTMSGNPENTPVFLKEYLL